MLLVVQGGSAPPLDRDAPFYGKPAAPLCFEDAESLKDGEPLVKLPEACYFDRFNRLLTTGSPPTTSATIRSASYT